MHPNILNITAALCSYLILLIKIKIPQGEKRELRKLENGKDYFGQGNLLRTELAGFSIVAKQF